MRSSSERPARRRGRHDGWASRQRWRRVLNADRRLGASFRGWAGGGHQAQICQFGAATARPDASLDVRGEMRA